MFLIKNVTFFFLLMKNNFKAEQVWVVLGFFTSCTVKLLTLTPKLCSCRAAANPAAPAPMMMTDFWKTIKRFGN